MAEVPEHLLDGTIARGAIVLGLALLAGPPFLAVVTGTGRRAGGVTGAGAALLLGGVALQLGGTTWAIAGALDVASLREVLTTTSFGASAGTGAIAAVLTVAAAALAAPVRSPVRAALAVGVPATGVLLALGRSGHPGSLGGSLTAAAHAAHVGAAVLWLGGLLLLVERGASTDPAGLRRFSRVATVAVLVLLAAGGLLAARIAGGPDGFTGRWGAVLGLKAALALAALAVARGHRRRLPALSRGPAGRAAFDRALLLEAGLALTVLLLGAVLSQLPPR